MRRVIYITVFFSGLTTLAIEMAASRLLGNIFGTSNLVWASIIGLILIYLTLGYYVGGNWAERSPKTETFYQILIWSSVLVSIVPVVSQPVLRLAANAFDQLQLGILFGSFVAVIILLSVPITLLGTASPFAIKLMSLDDPQIGKVSGKIYAVSTLGSFVGTFLPVLVFIPLIGTSRTFIVSSAVLLVISLYGFAKTNGFKAILYYLWTPLFLIILYLWGLPGSIKTTDGQIYETESSYNYIQVIAQDEYRLLRLNEGQGIHSIYHPSQQNYYGSWEQVLVAPFFNTPPYDLTNVRDMAIVGLAAGTTARQAAIVFKDIQIDGFEIDPKIIEVGERFFAMRQPGLTVLVEDGRWGLEHSDKLYQIISVDAYRPPYIPAHMTTVEFFTIVKDHLTEDGVLVINVGRGPTDRRLIDALATTISVVFPSIYVIDIPNTFNSIIFATVQPTLQENLVGNLAYLGNKENISPLLIDSMKLATENLQQNPPRSIVFTDDKAPLEWITNTMIVDFIFSDELEYLQ